jgi:rare lipoprotein A (peptidoglycan hydrolase)
VAGPNAVRRSTIGLFAGATVILAVAFVFSAPVIHAAECTWLTASHYGKESGRRTADGSYFDGSQMVAAHRTWKLGTPIIVSYRGKSVRLVVRDRGPYIRGRQLDISTAAARRIGLVKAGVGKVCVTRLR